MSIEWIVGIFQITGRSYINHWFKINKILIRTFFFPLKLSRQNFKRYLFFVCILHTLHNSKTAANDNILPFICNIYQNHGMFTHHINELAISATRVSQNRKWSIEWLHPSKKLFLRWLKCNVQIDTFDFKRLATQYKIPFDKTGSRWNPYLKSLD